MKTLFKSTSILSTFYLLSFNSVLASSGVVSELKLPIGVSATSVKVTENYTLVGNINASFAGKSNAGEVLVYSNMSGKLLLRLRSTSPVAGAQFGRLLTAQGKIAYVTDGSFDVHAISLTTGKTLWTVTSQSAPGTPLPGKSVQIESLAVDSHRLYLGMPDAWTFDFPDLGFYNNEGMALVFHAQTGSLVTSYTSTHQEAFAQFGDSAAAGGGYYALGAPAYDNEKGGSPVSNQGMVVVGHQNGWRERVLPPSPTVNQYFGHSVAIAGFSLYIGTGNGNAVYHYDLRNLGLIETINAPGGSSQFGLSLSASGHLLVIGDSNGSWLYDRQAKTLVSIFEESKAIVGPVKTALSLCGPLAAGPASGRVFRATNVAGARFAGSSVVATTRTAASGLAPKKFSTIGEMAVTDTGVTAHTARLSGGVTPANDTGLWSTLSGSHDLVLREGDKVGSTRAGRPFRPFFASNGHGRFLARLSTGGLGVWGDDGVNTFPILSEGGIVGIAGLSGPATVSRLREAAASTGNSTLINFILRAGNGINAGNDSLIARPALLASVEVREGVGSGVSGVTYGQIAPRLASAGTRLAYSTALVNQSASANAAVFAKAIGMTPPIMLAQKGEAAHHLTNPFPDSKFRSFIGESVSSGGTVYRAKFTSGKTVREALWFHNHQSGSVLTNTSAVAWVDGQPSGTAPGVKYRRFLKTFITDSGDVIFMAQIKGPGVSAANDVGIWRRNVSGGQVTLIIREGDAIPNSDGAALGTIQRLDVAGGGRWMILARLTQSPAARNQMLLVGNTAGFVHAEPLQRKGDVLDRTVPSRLLGLGMANNHCDAAGMGSKGIAKLVGATHVLYNAVFPHGTELVRSTVFGN